LDISIAIEERERDFILACVRKERWAQKKLYEDHYGMLMAICLRYAKDREEAMDILHEGYIKIFKNIGKYNPGTSLKSWMKRIVVNTSIDYYRKMVRRRTEDISEAYNLYSDNPSALDQMSSKEILAAVQTLTPAYRLVFNLYILEGFSHREISDRLGITESTSRSNLVKARMKLREVINRRNDYGAE
jgi:RNA polymerase sigma-70 factor (ECF subfamily)